MAASVGTPVAIACGRMQENTVKVFSKKPLHVFLGVLFVLLSMRFLFAKPPDKRAEHPLPDTVR